MNYVYLFGSGASVPAGLPVVSNFKQTAEEVLREGDFSGEARQAFEGALDWWQTVYPEANIEEAFILVDLLQELDRDYRLPAPGEDKQFGQQAFWYLIAKTLMESFTPNPTYENFLQALHQPTSPLGLRPSIITTNWDRALERATRRDLFGWVGRGFEDRMPEDEFWDRERVGTPLIKLHGSIDWWHCQDCGYFEFEEEHPRIRGHWDDFIESIVRSGCQEGKLCPDCQGKTYYPEFVPPVGRKFDPNRPDAGDIGYHWSAAEDRLVNADRLYVVGYSFPPTDAQLRGLVVNALRRGAPVREIVVVTNPKHGSAKVEFEDHFSSIFEPSGLADKVAFNYDGFEEWASRHTAELSEMPGA